MGKKIAFLIIISILIIGLNIFAMPESVSASDIQPVVVINPGHGYYEPGACHSGITELSLNNSLSIKIYNVLIKAGYDVYFAQNFAGNPAPNKTLASGTIYTWNLSPKYDPEEGTPLSTLINKLDPDLVITVHHNSSASQAINGYELYAYGRQGSAYTSSTGALSTKSIYFANVLNQEFSALTHVGSRGVQVTYKHQFHQYVTSPTLLIEAGFMSNPSELTKLCNASNQQKMANQVRDAVNRFFAQYPVENEQEPEIENISLYPVAGNAGEIYTTTIVTSDNVTKIRFYTDTSDSIHTYHSTITLASSGVTVINNKDGTKTWTINKTIGKTGDRTFSYKAGNGSSWTGYSTVEFSVLEVTGKLSEISSVVMNPVSGYSGEIFTAEIVTFSDVTQLDFYSDGKTPFEYKYSLTGSSDGVTIITEGESSTWTVETEVGRLGNRIFSYKAFNGSSWSEGFNSVDFTVAIRPPEILSINVTPSPGYSGDIYTTTIITDSNVDKIAFYSAQGVYHSTLTAVSNGVALTNNSDGTDTWIIKRKLTKTGDKCFVYKSHNGGGWSDYAEINFEVKVIVEPVISDISISPVEAEVGDIYTTTIITDSNVDKIAFYSEGEYHSQIFANSSGVAVTDNGDGTETWVISRIIGKTGDRTYSYKVHNSIGWSELQSVNFTVNEITLPAIDSISIDPVAGNAGNTYTTTIVTDSNVDKIAFYSEGVYHSQIFENTSGVTVTDNRDGTETWMISRIIGKTGDRTFAYKVHNSAGWSEVLTLNFSVQ